jgi:hypothetical protein
LQISKHYCPVKVFGIRPKLLSNIELWCIDDLNDLILIWLFSALSYPKSWSRSGHESRTNSVLSNNGICIS